ncbi:tetratricopeptide repeat protein [Clostridium lundense]|uniref:tetratricopeptide repeat protein n=1 Tax=Clostridium lundense TaxID=319475 RepID=UPI000487AC31|nr:hypothetical protein [Clostridium lundense]
MFKNLSLKSKLIIFFILSIVSIYFIFNGEVKNKSLIEETKETKKVSEEFKNDTYIKSAQENKGEKAKSQQEKNNDLEQKYNKGYKAFFDKKYDEAIKIENEVIKEDSKFYKAYNVKGIALCFNGNFNEGMKNIDKALEIKPDYGYARFNKALAYELYEKYEEALKWYDKDLEVENYIWSYYGKASIYGRRGQVEKAIENLKIAISMDKSIKEEARREKDFDPIRENEEFKNLVK